MNRIASREEQLFAEAVARPAGERAAFLDRACGGDSEQRARIEALLAAHEATASLRAPRLGNFNVFADEAPGTVIGRYKLLQKIGEGGCGVVWMAEQAEPVRRRVALKVIKAGMDTHEVIARFEAERQALAMMDHPGIAKVLDAGATDARRPFFVMDLVRGVRITRYCDEHQLDITARLGLFIQVCDAVQHAHQKGIIHRDLKPSNILVSMDQRSASVKVIDFGIAKATQGRLTDATLVTTLGQLIGTPAYMSPEQAGTSGLDVDTRSDIYSLGVLLYELLVGHTPFDPNTLQRSNYEEIRRIIREVEPAKPSTHFRTLAAAEREKVARARSADASTLAPLLAGDLDWIVMRALEKSPARRYETPNAFADDIGRHLAHELVRARPPSTSYRLGRFIRRNRLAVGAAAGIALALVIGTIVSLTQTLRARRAENIAALERERAIGARSRAEILLEFMLGDLRTEVQKLGKLDLLDLVGDRATAYFASLQPRDLNDTALLRQATMLRQIGEVQVAKGNYAEAMESFEVALARASALVNRQPRNGAMLFERGQAEYWIGMIHRKRRDLGAMAEWWARYRDTGTALEKLDPNNATWQGELAWGLHNMAAYDHDCGRVDEARHGFIAELGILSKLVSRAPHDLSLEFRVVDANSWLGSLEELSGNLSEAARRFSQQVAELEQIVSTEPENRKWQANLADALGLRAAILGITGERPAALICRRRAAEILRGLVLIDAKNRSWQNSLMGSLVREARLEVADGNWAKADALLDESLPGLEKLAVSEPTDVITATNLATGYRIRAEVWEAAGHSDVRAMVARAVELGERIIAKGSPKPEMIGELARAHTAIARLAARAHDFATAAQHGRRAREVAEGAADGRMHWQVLDAQARAFAFLEENQRAELIIEQLRRRGYVPLEPWRYTGR